MKIYVNKLELKVWCCSKNILGCIRFKVGCTLCRSVHPISGSYSESCWTFAWKTLVTTVCVICMKKRETPLSAPIHESTSTRKLVRLRRAGKIVTVQLHKLKPGLKWEEEEKERKRKKRTGRRKASERMRTERQPSSCPSSLWFISVFISHTDVSDAWLHALARTQTQTCTWIFRWVSIQLQFN